MEEIYPLQGSCVMVAGGAGFVGSALVRELLDYDARIVVYDNFLHGAQDNVAGLSNSDQVTVITADVLDKGKLEKTIRDFSIDYIFDFVGDTFVPTAYEIPQRFFDINLQGTFNVLMAARNCGVRRVLYVSSTEVYGEHRGSAISENVPLAPLNTYAVSKLAADRLCFTFFVEHKIPVVIARIFNCYGPRETHPYVIPEIISQLNRGPILRLGNIEAERDFTYVHDTARALIQLLTSNIPNGETVNVGSGTSWQIGELAQIIAEVMETGPIEVIKDARRLRRLDIDRFQCDNAKLRRYTGWSPQINLKQGLKNTVQWFKDNNCQWCWEKSSNDFLWKPANSRL